MAGQISQMSLFTAGGARIWVLKNKSLQGSTMDRMANGQTSPLHGLQGMTKPQCLIISIGGEKQIDSRIPVYFSNSDTVWSIGLRIPLEAATKSADEQMRMQFLMGLLISLVTLLLVLILSRRITEPLLDLSEAAARISRGNYDHPVTPRGTGEIRELCRAFRDMVTQVQQGRQHLQNSIDALEIIIEKVPFGMVLIDSQHKITRVNREALAICGKTEAETLNQPCYLHFCMDTSPICPIEKSGNHPEKQEMTLRKKNGSLVPVLTTVIPSRIYGKKMLIKSIIDISEIKEKERELERAKTAAEQASRARSEFFGQHEP